MPQHLQTRLIVLAFILLAPTTLIAQTNISFMQGWFTMSVPGNWQKDDNTVKTGEDGLRSFDETWKTPETGSMMISMRFSESNSAPVTASELQMLYKFGGSDGFEIRSSEILTINGREWHYGITEKTSSSPSLWLHEFQTDTPRGSLQVSFYNKNSNRYSRAEVVEAMKKTMKVE